MSKAPKTPVISIVVPTYNEEGNVERLFNEVKKELKDIPFEVIFVNDGSRDNSLKVLKKMAIEQPQAHYIAFSRNFGHQSALRAGLAYARGEAVISMDADLQHPPQLLPKLIEKWHDGYEVVYTVRKDTRETGFFKRFTAKLFYLFMNFLSGLKIEEGAADFRLLDRKVVDVINAQNEPDLFLRGYIQWLGFDQIGIPYQPAKRFSGRSTYTFKKMISLAGKGVTGYSIKPLRLAFFLAGLMVAACIAIAIYAIWMAATGTTVPGWASMVFIFAFVQAFQFLLLGVIGEYLGRTFMQAKHRPEYIVGDTDLQHPGSHI